jgi:hypothetical protein
MSKYRSSLQDTQSHPIRLLIEDPKEIKEIARHYLETGEDISRAELAYKPPFPRPTKEELLAALSQEVRRREQEHPTAILPSGINPLLLARSKAEPMARGFFPAVERKAVQRVLEQSVIFLTADNIHRLITSVRWLRTAWRIANIYLDSIDAAPMGKDEDLQPVGLGEETTSYISLKYFNEDDPFADYVVHEMAHLFHNWKRALIGLRETRYKEFLLNISFARREIFAFSCEAYSRILELGKTPSERRQLFKRFSCESRMPLSKEREELLKIVETAVEARNGWKRILKMCSDRTEKIRNASINSVVRSLDG